MTSITPSTVAASPAAPWTPQVAHSRPAATGAALSPADLLRIVRQRFFTIFFVSLLGIAATVGTTALVQRYYPLYTADRIVQITSLLPPDPTDPFNRRGMGQEDYNRLLLDQSTLALSTPVINETLRDPSVIETAWYREAKEREQADASHPREDTLRDTMRVDPVRQSSLLHVTASCKNPKDAQTLVMVLVDKYIRYADQLSRASVQDEQAALKKQQDAIQADITSLDQTINEHLAQYPYIRSMLIGQRTPVDDNVLIYNNMKKEFAIEAYKYQAEWEQIERAGSAADIPVPAEILEAVERDPLIIEYRQKLSGLDETRLSVSTRLGPEHPTVKRIDANVADLKEKLEKTRREGQARLAAQVREEAQKRWEQANRTLNQIEEQYQEAVAQQRDQEQQVKKYRENAGKYEDKRKALDDVSRNLSNVDAMIARERRVKITAPPAEEPRRRSRPDWVVYLAVGTMISLSLGFGLALLLELADTSVRTSRDLLRHADLSFLGAIPNADDDEVPIDRIETATLTAPHSVTAEAFRQVRTNLFFAAPAELQGSILVCSASPGEGKTTVAINLACALAMSGRRILLVDANFRRPSLRTFFTDLKAEGLSNVLVGQVGVSDVTCPSGIPGLDVISAGPIPPNPAELLGGSYVRKMIADARSRYDQIIFDGPPLLLVSDAMVMSRFIDGILLVCRFRHTSRGALQRAHRLLAGINARVLGAVLNAVEVTRGGYFREQYKAFYEYQADNGAAALPGAPQPPTKEEE